MKTIKLLVSVLLLTFVISCSKEETPTPQTILKEVIVNTHTTDTVYIDTCDTIIPTPIDTITTKIVRLELYGGNNNTVNYSSNGSYIYVSTMFYQYEFELDANEFIQLDASFWQLYGTGGGGPLYPWLSIGIFVDGVSKGTISESTSYLGYTYTNDYN